MNPNLSLALAIGGGLVGLVVLHSMLSGQSAAASAITVGATLTSPFNVMGDTSGSLVNAAAVSDAIASATSSPTETPPIGVSSASGAPAGVPIAGWGAALSGMHDVALGVSPAAQALGID